MAKVHNFSAGPGILPQEVLNQAAAACINFNNLNLSLLEISHRSKDYVAVMDEAIALVKRLLGVPEGYSVVFVQGGASTQFAMAPFNFLSVDGYAAYTDTGTWANKAIKEAKMLGNVKVLASSKDANYNFIPKDYEIPSDADYFHITSNNTIFGTQVKEFPNSPVPMLCDMSSDIFSRKIDVSKFGLIYAGAQKNMGPAGSTLAIVKDELLGKNGRKIPSMLDYKIHIDGESMYNTPPVFAVYVSMLTLQWLEKNGGVEWIEKVNQQKADLLYGEIERNPLFKGTTAVEDRSNMNACFVCNDDAHTPLFDKFAQQANLDGLKGHRSVGGFRASIYNAMPLESVQALVDAMKTFETKFG